MTWTRRRLLYLYGWYKMMTNHSTIHRRLLPVTETWLFVSDGCLWDRNWPSHIRWLLSSRVILDFFLLFRYFDKNFLASFSENIREVTFALFEKSDLPIQKSIAKNDYFIDLLNPEFLIKQVKPLLVGKCYLGYSHSSLNRFLFKVRGLRFY